MTAIYYPSAEVEAALRKCKAMAYARGKQAGRDEATQFVQWAAQLNGSTHSVLKALGADDEPVNRLAGLADAPGEGEPDHAEVVTLALIDALTEAKLHHADSDGGAVAEYLASLLSDPKALADGMLFKAWDADKHPRDDGGRFVSKEAIHAAKSDPKKAEALRERVTDPEQRKKLDAAIAGETDLGRTKAGEKKDATAKTREEKATRLNRARELANEISMARRGGAPVPPEHFTELAEHLPHMTVADLRSTRIKLAASFGGGRKRDEMVAKLTAHAKQRAEELNAPDEEPLDFGMFDVEGEKDDPKAKEPVDELQGRNRKRELLNTLDAVRKTGAGELPSDVVKRVESDDLPPALAAIRDGSPEDVKANKGSLERHDIIESAARGTFGPEVKAAVLRALAWERYEGDITRKHLAVGEELRKLAASKEPVKEPVKEPEAAPAAEPSLPIGTEPEATVTPQQTAAPAPTDNPAPAIASQNSIDENVRDKADRVAVAKKFKDTGKLSASEANAFVAGDTPLTAGNFKWKVEKAGEALGLTPEQVQHAIANTKPSGTMKKPGMKKMPTYQGSDFLRTLGMVDEPVKQSDAA